MTDQSNTAKLDPEVATDEQVARVKLLLGRSDHAPGSGYFPLLIARIEQDSSRLATAATLIEALSEALATCNGLFDVIRGDWSDPRSECREGWGVIAAALALRAEWVQTNKKEATDD